MRAYESDIQEYMWLTDGSISELKLIKKLSLNDYYGLMKFVIDKNKETLKHHSTVDKK